MMDDADFPRECEVCRKPPRVSSIYCSDRCEAIVEGPKMHTAYAIQHRTTKRYLVLPPSMGVLRETADLWRVQTWEYQSLAEVELAYLGSFADAYKVVQVSN